MEEVDPGVGEDIKRDREGGGNALGEGHGWEGEECTREAVWGEEGKRKGSCQALITSVEKS